MEHPQSFHGKIMKTYGKTHVFFRWEHHLEMCWFMCYVHGISSQVLRLEGIYNVMLIHGIHDDSVKWRVSY